MKKIILTLTIISGLLMAGCAPTPTPAVVFPTEAPTVTAEPTAAPTEISPTAVAEAPTETPAPTEEPTEVAVSGRPVTISKIHMADSMNGMAIGGDFGQSTLMLATDDGGATWSDMTPPIESMYGGDVQWNLTAGFYGQSSVWMIVSPVDLTQPDGPVVMYSSDSGSTFTFSELLDVSGLDVSFFVSDIQFVNEQTGWLLAHVDAGMNHDYIAIYRTDDGGAAWQRILDPFTSQDSGVHSCAKTGMFFTDEQTGYLTGTCNGVAPGALFFRTADGGATWQKVELPDPASQPGLFESGETACGTENPQMDADGTLHLTVSCRMFTSDPAKTLWFTYAQAAGSTDWTSAEFPGGTITYLDGSTWVAASPNWNRTSDAGATWQQTGEQTYTVNQIQSVGSDLFAVAQGETDGRLYHSTDQGQTWQVVQTGLN